MDVPFFGGCRCGAIRYQCSEPAVAMLKCHCRDCQRAGGAGYAPTLIVRASSFKLLRGQPKLFSAAADSGATARRAFCGECGSPLFASSSAREQFIGVRAGSLDDPSAFAPQAEVWVASAQSWDHLDPDLPAYARNRPRASAPSPS